MNSNKLDLWRIWLLMFTVVLHIYLIFTTIKDYLHLKSNSFDPLYGGDWSYAPMGFKLSCLLCSITFLPLIIITSVIVTGNLANDGHVLGKSMDNNHFIIDSDSQGQMILVDLYKTRSTQNKVYCASHRFIIQQFVPISVFLQILSGFCYLAPQPFVEAQQIEHKSLGFNYMWHTDLDFMIDTDKNHGDFAMSDHFQLPMRPAYFNMIYCLSLLSFQYPSVFWKTHRSFCLLFYLIIILLSVHVLLDYSAISILIRLSIPDILNTDLISSFHPILISLISFMGSLLLIVLQMTIFNFGFEKYMSSLAANRQSLRHQYKAELTKKSVENEDCSNTSSDSVGLNESESMNNFDFHSIFIKFRAHLVAILLGSLAMGMKAPLLLHQWKLYLKTGDQVMYLNVIVAALFCVLWLVTWFSFTVNNNWRFKVISQFKDRDSVKENSRASVGGLTSNTLPATPTNAAGSTVLLANAGSPTYATCRPASSSSLKRVLLSPNHQVANQLPLDENDLTNCYNYVLLHKANNATPDYNGHNLNSATYATSSGQMNKSRDTTSPTFVNVEGKIINTDDLYGSEISSESNFSRSLTAQEKIRYLPQDQSDGMVNRLLLNRYYSIENPNTKRIPFVRSPLLSYQFSSESSPSEQNRKQMNSQSKVTFTDGFIGAEPDLITHKYPVLNISDMDRLFDRNDLSPTLDQMRVEFLRSDNVAMESYLKEILASSPTGNTDTMIVRGNDKSGNGADNATTRDVDDSEQNINREYLMKLNGMDDNNEGERLCSQV